MAPKNVVLVDGQVRYIAKRKSKKNSSEVECVTEYLISRIGRQLPLKVAEGQLARFPVKPGEPPQVHFMSRVFIREPSCQQLLHGVQLAAICFEMDRDAVVQEIPPWSPQERSFYTIEMIDDLLHHISISEKNYRAMLDAFARMMAFDALIGANDRHSENWGLVVDPTKASPPCWAPLYDTARGLFWQWNDERLEGVDRANKRDEFIRQYAARSEPLISANGLSRPNHFEVVREMADRYPDKFARGLRSVVEHFRPDDVTSMLHREFRLVLSRRRLEFIDHLLRTRHEYLRTACLQPM